MVGGDFYGTIMYLQSIIVTFLWMEETEKFVEH